MRILNLNSRIFPKYQINKNNYNNQAININKNNFDYVAFSSSSQNINYKRKKQLEKFQEQYNLKFNDINLLNQAFTFGVNPYGYQVKHLDSYERLEFLGDDVLELCINKILMENYPDYNEGQLTRLKQSIVSNENIAKYSKKLELDKMTELTPSTTKRLADIFEALLGAIFVDGKDDGFKNAYKFIQDNFANEILKFKLNESEATDYKMLLKKYINNLGLNSNNLYYYTDITDINDDGLFTCKIYLENEILAAATMNSARKAEQKAAQIALEELKP